VSSQGRGGDARGIKYLIGWSFHVSEWVSAVRIDHKLSQIGALGFVVFVVAIEASNLLLDVGQERCPHVLGHPGEEHPTDCRGTRLFFAHSMEEYIEHGRL
jgi:hypothetical protein